MFKMPLRDKTGPMGKGPLTGRGLGPCKIIDKKNIKKGDVIDQIADAWDSIG